jgi:hypothetical protein
MAVLVDGAASQLRVMAVPPALVEVDIDGDGVISAGDIEQAVAHYGETAPP